MKPLLPILCFIFFWLGWVMQIGYHQSQDWYAYWDNQRIFINKVVVRIDELNKVPPKVVAQKPPVIPWDRVEVWMKKIRHNESSDGTAGLTLTCKKNGMINDYGYKGGAGFCFPDEIAQNRAMVYWYQEHKAKGLTFLQANCHYNTGRKENITTECVYFTKYLKTKI